MLRSENFVFLSPPDLVGSELKYVKEAFDSNYIACLGPMTEALENALSKFTKIPYCLALNSGTAALCVALAHVGIRSGDIVIASDLTFIASVSYAYHIGADLRFIDSRFDDWNMDPYLLRQAFEDCKKEGKKPKAVVVTDLYGQCADYDAIRTICDDFDVPMITDSCEALGAVYKGRHAGYDSFACALSFNGNKIITTSGGGALLSHDEKLIKHARKLATQARENCAFYEHKEVGFNYRMSNICAAIGLGQMEGITKKLEKKHRIFDFYRRRLSVLGDKISFMPEISHGCSNHWLSVIRLNRKRTSITPEKLLSTLNDNNIEGRHVWKPMHLQPVFKHNRYYGNGVGDVLFASGVCLPSGTALTDKQLERICACIENVLR